MKRLLVLISALLLSACAGTFYDINVSGMADSAPRPAKAYILGPGAKDSSLDDLEFKEYATYLTTALADQGLERVAPGSAADLVILVFYGIGDPVQSVGSYSLPVFGQTGVASSTTTGTINRFGNTATFNANTINTPQYGVVGSTTHVYSHTDYPRYLRLVGLYADDLRQDRTAVAFDTRITSVGSSGDLRAVMPALVAAARPYFTKNTGRAINIALPVSDKRIKAIAAP